MKNNNAALFAGGATSRAALFDRGSARRHIGPPVIFSFASAMRIVSKVASI
jgi:hypothetical protein